MSSASNRVDGNVIRDFLSVADILKEPQLAKLYAYIAREDEATVTEVMDVLNLTQGTAYTYVNQLVDTGVLEVTSDDQPRTYATRDIGLTITTPDKTGSYTITASLIDAVGRRTTDEDIDTYIDRHGIAGLATALTYAVDRERGDVTHRTMASDLDISALAVEIILQALRPIVTEYYEIEQSGVSVADIQGVDHDLVSDET